MSDINSKEKILKSVIKLFAQKGYDAVSIREICKDAGCNICMISYYWGGKQELYNGIIENLLEAQMHFASSFIDFNKKPEDLSREEKIKLLELILDKCVDFFYANITNDLILILLREQQKNNITSPKLLKYLRKLLACILGKKETDREVILKTVFILSQINSPKILPAFSLSLLGQEDFTQEDIKIIKENVKLYVQTLIKEAENA